MNHLFGICYQTTIIDTLNFLLSLQLILKQALKYSGAQSVVLYRVVSEKFGLYNPPAIFPQRGTAIMKPFNKSTKTLFALCASSCLLISGCSSSDNTPSRNAVSNPQQSPDNQVSQTEINGSVIKGAISNADVYLYSLSGKGIGSTPFASTKTDNSGSFNITIPSASLGDAIYVEVQAAADGSSTMICDVEVCGAVGEVSGEDTNGNGQLDFGEPVNLTEEFYLSGAITDFKNSESLQVSVTPISHLAVQNAKRKGKLDANSINAEFNALAQLFNLPVSLSQITALDLTRLPGGKPDLDTIRYSLYNAAVAGYAKKHHLTIAAAIAKIEADLYNKKGEVNRELLVELLELAHEGATWLAKGNVALQELIAQIALWIERHHCHGKSKECGQIDPPDQPEPPHGELAKVKELVSDFRSWVRELTLQNNPALANFKARTQMVGRVWEDDIKVLASALNDVLPGVAQAISPTYDFCYYCEVDGLAFAAASVTKELTLGNLHYVLSSDGTLDIEGTIRDVDVDIQLLLPAPEDFAAEHAIAIQAGRLTRDNMELVIGKGSQINAVFPEDVLFDDVISGIRNHVAPVATQLTAEVNFAIEAEYGIAPGGTIDFETPITVDWLDTGDWSVTDTKGRSGTSSLRSPQVGDGASTSSSATINTWGGYLSFNYAVESEAGYDFFNVYVDGEKVLTASGFQPEFKSANIFLAPGEHTIVWEYAKDDSVGHNKDAVWIDDIQYPTLAGDATQELVSHNILSGRMAVSAFKLDQPWYFASQGYLPGEIRVNAVFSNQFIVGDSIEEDEISLVIAATIENAAEFVPPQPYDEGTLGLLGNYTVSPDLFTFNLQDWSIRITPEGDQTYRYEVYRTGEETPIQSYLATSNKTTMKDVAGDLIENSGIGLHIVVPQEGLYITTLLRSSPWGNYTESRFDAAGGNIYGYLVEPYQPTETEEQFLRIAAAFEMQVRPYDLPEVTLGSNFTRDTLNEGTFEFYLVVDGKRFNFSSNYWYNLAGYGDSDSSVDAKSPTLTITNQNGVALELAFPDVDDVGGKKVRVLEGSLRYNNKVYGTVKREKGITFIHYIDGTGESIE